MSRIVQTGSFCCCVSSHLHILFKSCASSFFYISSQNKKIFCESVEHLRRLATIYDYAVLYPHAEFIFYIYPGLNSHSHICSELFVTFHLKPRRLVNVKTYSMAG